MSRPQRIGASAALAQLSAAGHGDWRETPGRDAIARTFRFSSFAPAFAWMTRVALAAETLDHHPEWFNVYDRVEVVLATHDADGVTELDVRLALLMEEAARGS